MPTSGPADRSAGRAASHQEPDGAPKRSVVARSVRRDAAEAGLPIEIGNRLWVDDDRDGVQDPSESPVSGVKVALLDARGSVVQTVTTSARGEYYFTNVVPASAYRIVIDSSELARLGADGMVATIARSTRREIDSDGVNSGGSIRADVVTPRAGTSDHTFDIGLVPAGPDDPPGGGTGTTVATTDTSTQSPTSSTAVRGTSVARSPSAQPAMARTGATTGGITAVGVLILLVGAAFRLVRRSRRG